MDSEDISGSEDSFDDILLGFTKNRYYIDKQSRTVCYNCGQRGHTREKCKAPAPCFLCGSGGHMSHQCVQGVCYNCFRPGHNRSDCPKPKCSAYCKLCNLNGHDERCCPDMWRSYIKVESKETLKKSVHKYCFNCGKDGHFGDDCTLPNTKAPIRIPMNNFSCFISDKTLLDCGYNGRNLHELDSKGKQSQNQQNNNNKKSPSKSQNYVSNQWQQFNYGGFNMPYGSDLMNPFIFNSNNQQQQQQYTQYQNTYQQYNKNLNNGYSQYGNNKRRQNNQQSSQSQQSRQIKKYRGGYRKN